MRRTAGIVTFLGLVACTPSFFARGTETDGGQDAPVTDAAPSDAAVVVVVTEPDASRGGDARSPGIPDAGVHDASPPTCPAQLGFQGMTYPAVALHQGMCVAADFSTFIESCGDGSTPAACQTWRSNNTGPSGNQCGNCIMAADSSGATLFAQDGTFMPNYGACIQAKDPTAGAPNCASTYDGLLDCEAFECDDCSGPSAEQACKGAVAAVGSWCSVQQSQVYLDCEFDLFDGGAVDQCTAGSGPGALDASWEMVLDLVCGDAAD
jgi:hypothetical protein